MADSFDSVRANLRNLASPKNLEIGRNLVASISELVAQAAGEASRNLKNRELSDGAPLSLEHRILHQLASGELSSVSLRKELTKAAGGEIPNQTELKVALEALAKEELIELIVKEDKKSYQITEKGASHLTQHSELKPKTKCECGDKSESMLVMRQAQRLSSAVLDAAVNGTNDQRLQIAQELETARLAILRILAGEKLD